MRFWIGAAVVAAALVAMAALVEYEYFFFAGYTVLMFVVLATAWNILGGYAGYVNFGTPAFFGLGAYSAAVLYKATAAPLAVQIALAAAMAGLLGFGAGLLTLRLRGIFFAIATIAVTVIMQTVFVNWRYAGGATGLQLLRPPPIAAVRDRPSSSPAQRVRRSQSRELPQRNAAEQHPAPYRDRQRERHCPRIHRDAVEARQIPDPRMLQPSERPKTQRQPERAARHAQRQALRQNIAHNPPPPRAERRPHRQLLPPPVGAHQQQIRDIRARDQQQRRHRSQ
jgi:hypothetical protein